MQFMPPINLSASAFMLNCDISNCIFHLLLGRILKLELEKNSSCRLPKININSEKIPLAEGGCQSIRQYEHYIFN